ncbi:MAG: hypothetical protein QOG48_76 [Verrucomicrobiota bacterium]
MKTSQHILQIVPRLPGEREAVGDYAETLSRKLHALRGYETAFVTGDTLNARTEQCDHVILHYVNYGYQSRGVPLRLLSILRELSERLAGKFITIFHELYASRPPWRSAFWLRPLQVRIARAIAQLSDHCIVTNEIARAQLLRIAPQTRVAVHPVFSNLGEPNLSAEEISNRDPHRWVICGGTTAILRALRSFREQHDKIPAQTLHVIGGSENDDARKAIVDLAKIDVQYRPNIEADEASRILRACSFAWFDYFHRENVPGPVILKSSAFAAACAHAIIPVFPHPVSQIADELPGPFSIRNLPASDRAGVAAQYYDWYQRHASSDSLTNAIADMLT